MFNLELLVNIVKGLFLLVLMAIGLMMLMSIVLGIYEMVEKKVDEK